MRRAPRCILAEVKSPDVPIAVIASQKKNKPVSLIPLDPSGETRKRNGKDTGRLMERLPKSSARKGWIKRSSITRDFSVGRRSSVGSAVEIAEIAVPA